MYQAFPQLERTMACRDESNSSDEEADDYTTTNVLLGYASREATEDTVSQLGGRSVGMSVTCSYNKY